MKDGNLKISILLQHIFWKQKLLILSLALIKIGIRCFFNIFGAKNETEFQIGF